MLSTSNNLEIPEVTSGVCSIHLLSDVSFNRLDIEVIVMRVLLDTNICIYREDHAILSNELQTMLRRISKSGAKALVHPLSKAELERDTNEDRRKKIISKVGSYCELASPPDPYDDDSFLQRVCWNDNDQHDRVDNTLLYAVYKDAVDVLITEDKGIHKKAQNLDLTGRVFTIREAITFFSDSIPALEVPSPPAITQEYLYNIDLDDPIFTSLKEEYEGFESWFLKVARAGRRCWVNYREEKRIGAILIYKIEDEPLPSHPPFSKKERVKIATLIVTSIGRKIGELFLRLTVDLALANSIDEIYLTHFTKSGGDDHLVDLISQFGFQKVAVKENGEDIYLKLLYIPKDIEVCSPLEISCTYFPCFFDGESVSKFIIPIQPQYHQRLFTDYPGRQTRLSEFEGEFIVEGNTIKKAYLTRSRITKLKPGDLVLFYRSQDIRGLTSLGVIESVYSRLRNPMEILRLVGKRSVYIKGEIEDYATRATTVILFNHHFHFDRPLNIGKLIELEVLVAHPQSITQIDHERYTILKHHGGLDERYTVCEAEVCARDH